MMNNMYSSYSSVISLRTTSFAFSDYNNYCNYPNERCPSICYCSCCYPFPVNSSRVMGLNINPSLLYGLRQSTLIQCPPSRRIVFGSKSPNYDVGCCCGEMKKCVGVGGIVGRSCKERYCVKESESSGVDRIRGRVFRDKRDFRCNALGVGVKEGNRGRMSRGELNFRCNALGVGVKESKGNGVDRIKGRVIRHERDFRCESLGDAEAMLSLLSEEGMEECVPVRARRTSFSKDVRSKEQNVGGRKCKDVKGDSKVLSGSRYLESKFRKQQVESNRVQSREEGHKGREERESVTINEEKLRRRKSSSSYYLSESSDYGSESEVDVNEKRFVGESSNNHRNDSRKTGGVVNEVTKDHQLMTSRHNNARVGNSSEWDWRKKSEKKLTEGSDEISKSMKESIMRQSKLFQENENNSMMAPSSKKQFSNQEEELFSEMSSRRQSRSNIQKNDSTSEFMRSSVRHEHSTTDVNFHEHSTSHFKTDNLASELTSGVGSHGQLKSHITVNNQESAYLESSQKLEQSSQQNRQNVESTSTITGRLIQDKGAMIVAQSMEETGCDYCRTCGRSNMEFEIEQRSELSGDARQATSVQSQLESGHSKQEIGTSSFQTMVEDENKQQEELHVTAGKIDAIRISGQYSEMSDSDYSYDQSTLRSQKQTEIWRTNLEDNSTSFKSSQDVKRLQEGSSARFIKKNESNKLLQTGTKTFQVGSTSVETNHHSASGKIISEEQTYSTSKLKEVKELIEKHEIVDETLIQTSRLRTEVQRPVLEVGLSGNFSEEANASQPAEGSISQTGGEVESKIDLQIVVMSPSYQLVPSNSSDSEPSRSFMREESRTTTEVRTTSFSDEANESCIGSLDESSPDNAMSSAEGMHESSTQIVGEFVEKMRHESSASGTRIEKESSQLNEKAGLVKQDSSRISGGSGAPIGEASELESSESAVNRRSGKSLWNIVSGIFRLRWSSNGTHKSPVKASQKSSSNDSANDETWFSGNEHDESSSNIMTRKQISMVEEPTSEQPLLRKSPTKSHTKDHFKKEQRGKSQEPTLAQPLLRRTTGISQKGDFSLTSFDGRLNLLEVDVSSSPSDLHGGLVSGGVSTMANTDPNISQQTSVSSPLGSLASSGRRLKRSEAFEEIEEVEKNEEQLSSTSENEELISSTSDLKGHSVDVMESGIPTSEKTEAEVKRKKLQRSKQVISGRFDEWEDAYRRENEQRRADEIFMREALAEALKAADSWEVPVGAVLVQNGKIIARGYNLVEELRDSTAHAEMNCIKEASNILRTWRLSETTLYVTLEPCPMCAGAILQARIKTLVWGAPNKLLGADGSWIRLFPEGVEGEQRSEVVDKPAPPAHPFHPNMNIRRGVLESECAQIMQQFFQLRRKKQKEKEKKSEEEAQPSCLPVPHNPTKLLRKMHGVFHIKFGL